ncbi:MAG: BBE domain-containing protein [Verrucomicrobiae bacterium]|nr:BBE domain-containing protein [Verrucomicrobiae bacterium]
MKTSYVNDLNTDAIGLLIERCRQVPSPQSHVVLYTPGGAVGRVPADATAVSYRNALHILLWVGMWNSTDEDESNRAWMRESWGTAERFGSAGFYPDYEAETAPERMTAAFGAAKFQRLAALKARFDPSHLFRLNQNIPSARVSPGWRWV